MWTNNDWHQRFTHQAHWTFQVREYLFERASLTPGDAIIEIGCGTGAVLSQIPKHARAFGLDIDRNFLNLAHENNPLIPLTCADAHLLPYPDQSFEAACCHFLLLWVKNPVRVLQEMARICKPGGAVLVLAEPDYGGRIDFPEELQQLGAAQTESLLAQGADPFLGRKLPGLMEAAGLKNIEIGIIGNQWYTTYDPLIHRSEWETVLHDLAGRLPAERLAEYREIDRDAWERGTRVLYVPTFYACGVVN